MRIITPAKIKSVAWEGELVAPPVDKIILGGKPPTISIGQPEIWAAAEAIQNEVGQTWSPPMAQADYWLLRLACTLRQPDWLTGGIAQAEQTLYLRPKNRGAPANAVYAYSLFPDRVGVEEKSERSYSLGPELKFGQAVELKAGQLGGKIEYRQVFPVIQSYGAGEPVASWIFKPHPAHPLDGSQFVYAVVAAKAGADGARANVELTITIEAATGLAKLGLSDEAKRHTRFTIP